MGAVLPGSRRSKRPSLNDVVEPYDREDLQRRILEALKTGPLEKWRLRELLAASDVKLLKELTTLRQAGLLKRVGNIRRRAQWALKAWHPPKSTPGQRAFNQCTPRPPTNTVNTTRKPAPGGSWWATARTREEFTAAHVARLPELTGHGSHRGYTVEGEE